MYPKKGQIGIRSSLRTTNTPNRRNRVIIEQPELTNPKTSSNRLIRGLQRVHSVASVTHGLEQSRAHQATVQRLREHNAIGSRETEM